METPEPIRLPVAAPDPQTEPPSVWEILRRWRQFADLDLADKSSREYRYWCVRFMADTLVDIRAATPQNIMDYLGSIPGHGQARILARQAMRHFFRWYVGMGFRPDNPTAILPRDRRKRRIPQWLTVDELNQLINAAGKHNPAWGVGLILIYSAGLRINEACSLTPEDIDLSAGTIEIRETKTGNDRVHRMNALSRAAVEALLPQANGTLLGVKSSAFRARFKTLGYMTGLPQKKLHPHALRHSAGTHLRQRGADIRQVMDFLGHTDPGMAIVYQHIGSDEAEEVSRLIG
jgi:site-specific recombinase XerD